MSDGGGARTELSPAKAKRYRELWAGERTAAWVYRALAEIADERSAGVLEQLAKAEDAHAGHWEDLLRRAGITDLSFRRAPWRDRAMVRYARRFGVEAVLPMLVRLEASDARKYVGEPDALSSMSAEEMQHGRTLATIGTGTPARIADLESRHRVSSAGALRAATFGINDGLVSNLSLVMGVAGGTGSSKIVLLAGIAGLLAGAFSMAAGEWISVRSQRELYEREIEIEREELAAFPDEERDELAMVYRAKGLDQETAMRLAERIMQRPDAALDTLVREELGLNPNDLASPWVAAGSSFVAFAFGALIPVIPYLIGSGSAALFAAASASAVVLCLVGFSISFFTGRGGFVSAARMLLLGAVAAAVTYGVGTLVGTAIG